MKTTKPMRNRLKELTRSDGHDDYDRAVACLLDDFYTLHAALIKCAQDTGETWTHDAALAALDDTMEYDEATNSEIGVSAEAEINKFRLPISTLEVTQIKKSYPLYDERMIYDVTRELLRLRCWRPEKSVRDTDDWDHRTVSTPVSFFNPSK